MSYGPASGSCMYSSKSISSGQDTYKNPNIYTENNYNRVIWANVFMYSTRYISFRQDTYKNPNIYTENN